MAEPGGNAFSAGGVNPAAASREELRQQPIDIKNMLPVYIFMGMEYASFIESNLPFGQTPQRRHIVDFHRTFWHIYNYVKNSVDMDKLNPDLVDKIDDWFELFKTQNHRTDLIEAGVQLFLALVKNMQEWGIGQLFEKGIDPPFQTEDVDDLEMLIEDLEEEVVADNLEDYEKQIEEQNADVPVQEIMPLQEGEQDYATEVNQNGDNN
jgi:hypothetical protein